MAMKHNRFFAYALVLILALTAVLAGCAPAKAAARAGDREITVAQLENYYNNSAPYASFYGYPLTTAEEVEAFQDYLLDSLIASEMTAYQARQSGIALTAEEQEEAKTAAQESYDSTYQSFVDAAKESGSTDVNAYAQKLFTDALVQNGTTVNKMKKDMLRSAEDELLVAKHKEALVSDAGLSAGELKARYDEELAAQKELFTETPSMYFTYETNAMYGYSAMPLFIPEGLFRVKHILVEDEQTAKEVKAKLDAGEDFDALLAEYGTDPGMQSEDNAAGYLIGEGASFVAEFLEAALKLSKEGDISAPVESQHGYHIIKRLADEPSREIPYEEIQETFDTYMQTSVQEEYYNGVIEGWISDETLVTRYPENYRSVGKAALAGVTPAPEATAVPEEEPEATPAPVEGDGNAPAATDGAPDDAGEGAAAE